MVILRGISRCPIYLVWTRQLLQIGLYELIHPLSHTDKECISRRPRKTAISTDLTSHFYTICAGEMKVWITYAYEDKNFVNSLKKILDRSGVTVLDVENQIMPGDNIIETIYKAISDSDVILVVLSESSSGRQWFSTEIGIVISEIRNRKNKRIIPILKDKEAEIPAYIDQYYYLDLSDEKTANDRFERLVATLLLRKDREGDNTSVDQMANEIIISRDALLSKEKYRYEKYRMQQQRQLRLVLMTTILATLMIVLALVYMTKDAFSLDDNWKTALGLVLTSTLIGASVSLIVNQFNKK